MFESIVVSSLVDMSVHGCGWGLVGGTWWVGLGGWSLVGGAW